MFNALKNWFILKSLEIRLRLFFLRKVSTFLDEKEHMLAFAIKLYESLRDIPPEELRDKLMTELASLAHEQATKEAEHG